MGTKSRMQAQAARFGDRLADLMGRYDIEERIDTPDGQGGYTSTWQPFVTIYGFVRNVRADEKILDDHIKTDRAKSFSSAFVAGITTDMRIVYENRYYNILSVKNVEDSDIWLRLVAAEDVAT